MQAQTKPLLEVRGVSKHYALGSQRITPVNHVDLTVYPGDFVSIIGKSGSGKSTLMHILGCLERPSVGTVLVADTDINQLDDSALSHFRNRTIGFVFQKFHLLERMSALRNVELPLNYRGLAPRARREQAEESLRLVGLGDRADHLPNQLSGGQQQRVAIARAIANQPHLLLMDEPTGNLDLETGEEIWRMVLRLHEQQHVALVLVTHDEDLARQARRQFLIESGHLRTLVDWMPSAEFAGGEA